jgi:hypothetical protein
MLIVWAIILSGCCYIYNHNQEADAIDETLYHDGVAPQVGDCYADWEEVTNKLPYTLIDVIVFITPERTVYACTNFSDAIPEFKDVFDNCNKTPWPEFYLKVKCPDKIVVDDPKWEEVYNRRLKE